VQETGKSQKGIAFSVSNAVEITTVGPYFHRFSIRFSLSSCTIPFAAAVVDNGVKA
jgi:hypothetical protein